MRPEAVDKKAAPYHALMLSSKDVSERMKRLRKQLINLARRHGAVPKGAPKSKRLEGFEFVITASFGESIKADTAKVAAFEAACDEARMKEFFAEIFTPYKGYQLTEDGFEKMSRPLPKKSPRNLRKLFDQAVKVEKRAPSVTVELRKSVSA
jgi:hypothetical protein